MASTASRRNLGRISEIAQVAVRHGFGYFFETHRLTDLLPGRPKLDPEAASPSERGRHLREMLDELGPTFVKFGQLLSTRPDVVPPDIVAELQKLQDDVRPVPYDDVERVIREELELSVEQLFTEFDPTPIAAASIGQVHRATLPNGRRVAVKVQRPNAPKQIEGDLSLLYQAARLIRERVRALEFIDPRQLVDEFARSIRQELDYRLEARNAEAFHHRFSGHPHVHIPRVYWSYTRTRVLTLELLEGVQLADLPLDAWEMEERRRLAYLMAETWMTMIFRHGFFHGDPHPANIFVIGRRGAHRARRLRPGREADRRGHVEADAALHRRRERAHRRPAAPVGRARRPLPEGARGRVRRRAARDVRALLRRQPRRDRPDAGDPRGVPADLPDEPAPADALRDARQGHRDARFGRRRALPGLQRLRDRQAVRAQA